MTNGNGEDRKIYFEPSTDSEVIGEYHINDKITYITRAPKSPWLKVSYNGVTGYAEYNGPQWGGSVKRVIDNVKRPLTPDNYLLAQKNTVSNGMNHDYTLHGQYFIYEYSGLADPNNEVIGHVWLNYGDWRKNTNFDLTKNIYDSNFNVIGTMEDGVKYPYTGMRMHSRNNDRFKALETYGNNLYYEIIYPELFTQHCLMLLQAA